MYDKKILERHYIPRINSRDKGHVILDWESEEAHLGRFDALLEHVDLTGQSILDVGCGIGDLLGYLKDRGIAAEYTGVDILPEMVEEARRRHPSGTFISGDLLEEIRLDEGSFDIVYSSGMFNLKVGDNQRFLEQWLEEFFRLARKQVIFNLLDPGHPIQRDIYYYFDPQEVRQIVLHHTPHVDIAYDYVPKDYTVFARVSP